MIGEIGTRIRNETEKEAAGRKGKGGWNYGKEISMNIRNAKDNCECI